jgi:hydrogenase maturation protease
MAGELFLILGIRILILFRLPAAGRDLVLRISNLFSIGYIKTVLKKMSNKTLILGLGNSILSDDRIGLDVARLVHKGLKHKDCDLIESQIVGANILDLISGYKTLIIIDAIKTKNGKDGDVYQLSLDDLPKLKRSNSPHNVGLCWTIKMGEKLGINVPDEIRIYAIEVNDPFNFGEELTGTMKKLLPKIVDRILEKEKNIKLVATVRQSSNKNKL